MEASIHSLFSFDTPDVDSVYGNIQGIKLGLQNLGAGLASTGEESSASMMRYVMAILHLERKFSARGDLQQVVRSRLQHSQFKAEHFTSHVNQVCNSVAAIYADTLSTLSFRVRVTGSAQHLQNEANAEIIRACLLAGVRSAHLWRQLGGRRWQLVLQRGRIRDAALTLSRELGFR